MSQWIFGHTMHLDQSRARPKIFDRIYYEISFFLLLAKSVAMEPFLPCAQSASSSSSSKSSLSSSSSSSSSLSSSSSSSPSCSLLNLIPLFFSSAFVRRRSMHLPPFTSPSYHRTKKGHNINHSTNYVKLSTCIFTPDKYLKHLDTPHVYRNVKFPSLGKIHLFH